jgi:hypothetical protein
MTKETASNSHSVTYYMPCISRLHNANIPKAAQNCPETNGANMLFLVMFGSRQLLPMCCDELDALISRAGINPRECYNIRYGDPQDDPFVVIQLPSSEVATSIAERSVTIKSISELWTLHDCKGIHDAVRSLASFDRERLSAFASPEISWRANIATFNHSLTIHQQVAVRRHFASVFPFKGPVKLKDAECNVTITVFMDFAHRLSSPGDHRTAGFSADEYPTLARLETLGQRALSSAEPHCLECMCCEHYADSVHTDVSTGVGPLARPNVRYPRRIFVGRELVTSTARRFLPELVLNKRPFLGPTSLDPELALIMTNMAGVEKNHIIYDPFVGTGSVLVAAQKLTGCLALGSDLDMRILRVRSAYSLLTGCRFGPLFCVSSLQGKDGVNLRTNYQHYGLGIPEVVRIDNAAPAMRADMQVDAIITDPPYGVRAGARRSGVAPEDFQPIPGASA